MRLKFILISMVGAFNIVSNVKEAYESTQQKIYEPKHNYFHLINFFGSKDDEVKKPKSLIHTSKKEPIASYHKKEKKLVVSSTSTSTTTTSSTTSSYIESSTEKVKSKHDRPRADPRLVPAIIYELDCHPGVLFHECTQECMASTERKTYEEAQKFTACIEICRDAYLLETVEGCIREDGSMVAISKDPVKYTETSARIRAVKYRLGKNMDILLSIIFYLLLCLVALGLVFSVKMGILSNAIDSLVQNKTGAAIKESILPISEQVLPLAICIYDQLISVLEYIKILTGTNTVIDTSDDHQMKSQELLRTLEEYEELPQD